MFSKAFFSSLLAFSSDFQLELFKPLFFFFGRKWGIKYSKCLPLIGNIHHFSRGKENVGARARMKWVLPVWNSNICTAQITVLRPNLSFYSHQCCPIGADISGDKHGCSGWRLEYLHLAQPTQPSGSWHKFFCASPVVVTNLDHTNARKNQLLKLLPWICFVLRPSAMPLCPWTEVGEAWL